MVGTVSRDPMTYRPGRPPRPESVGRTFAWALILIPAMLLVYGVVAVGLMFAGVLTSYSDEFYPYFTPQWTGWLLNPGAYVLCLPAVLLVARRCAQRRWWQTALLTWLVIAIGLATVPDGWIGFLFGQVLVFTVLYRVVSVPAQPSLSLIAGLAIALCAAPPVLQPTVAALQQKAAWSGMTSSWDAANGGEMWLPAGAKITRADLSLKPGCTGCGVPGYENLPTALDVWVPAEWYQLVEQPETRGFFPICPDDSPSCACIATRTPGGREFWMVANAEDQPSGPEAETVVGHTDVVISLPEGAGVSYTRAGAVQDVAASPTDLGNLSSVVESLQTESIDSY
jgi:hypothetical protein